MRYSGRPSGCRTTFQVPACALTMSPTDNDSAGNATAMSTRASGISYESAWATNRYAPISGNTELADQPWTYTATITIAIAAPK
jgi:hypothetical protein